MLRSDRGSHDEAPFAELYSKHGIANETRHLFTPTKWCCQTKSCTLKEMMNANLVSSS